MASNNHNNHVISVSMSSILRVLFVFLLIWFLYFVRDVLLIVVVAVVLAAALDPFVEDLEKIYVPRWTGVLLIYLFALGLVSFSVYLLVPPFSEQIGNLSKNLPQINERLSQKIALLRTSSGGHFPIESLSQALEILTSKANQLAGNVVSLITSIFGGIISAIIVLVLTFYLLVEREAMKSFIGDFIPKSHESSFIEAAMEIKLKIGRWFKGQLILSFLIFFLTLVGLLSLGVEYALTFALLAGITELIPYIGPVLGAIPPVIITFLDDPFKGLLVLGLFVLIQQLENHLIVPKVMQKSVGLSPVIIVVAVMVGARLAGFIGVLLAIPLATAVVIILKRVVLSNHPHKSS